MANKKNGKRKVSAKTLERRKNKKLKQLENGDIPHHNKAYVNPELQKQAGAHGESKQTSKHKRNKAKQDLKKQLSKEAY